MSNSPVCSKDVPEFKINEHLDAKCAVSVINSTPIPSSSPDSAITVIDDTVTADTTHPPQPKLASIFQRKRPREVADSSASSSSQRDREAPSAIPDHQATSKRFKTTSASSISNATRKSRPAPEAPLAEKVRPDTVSDFVGQSHLLGQNSLFVQHLRGGRVGSCILWGPPGTGKSTPSLPPRRKVSNHSQERRL